MSLLLILEKAGEGGALEEDGAAVVAGVFFGI